MGKALALFNLVQGVRLKMGVYHVKCGPCKYYRHVSGKQGAVGRGVRLGSAKWPHL